MKKRVKKSFTLLNELPKELIQLIMSYLNASECMSFSLVSKNFRNSWIEMPSGIIKEFQIKLLKYMNFNNSSFQNNLDLKDYILNIIEETFQKDEKKKEE